jgi:hypothetical protein
MGCVLKLLFVGIQLVAESWFKAFEIDWASKCVVVSKAWFSAIAVLVGCCWVSILSSDILGWARIDNVDGISMCMMEEGTAKSGSVQENVCRIVYFAQFGFTKTIGAAASHFISRSLHAAMNFADVKADLASLLIKWLDFVHPRNSVFVSQDLRAVTMDAVLSVGSPIQSINFPGEVK